MLMLTGYVDWFRVLHVVIGLVLCFSFAAGLGMVALGETDKDYLQGGLVCVLAVIAGAMIFL